MKIGEEIVAMFVVACHKIPTSNLHSRPHAELLSVA